MRRIIVLGNTYTDSLTGVSGVAVARHEYLYGCIRISLEFVKDGELKSEVFDEQRLCTKPKATSGGPRDTPVRPAPPSP